MVHLEVLEEAAGLAMALVVLELPVREMTAGMPLGPATTGWAVAVAEQVLRVTMEHLECKVGMAAMGFSHLLLELLCITPVGVAAVQMSTVLVEMEDWGEEGTAGTPATFRLSEMA